MNVASGPSSVIVASALLACFFFAPQAGAGIRRLRRRKTCTRTLNEDILKDVYKTELAGGYATGAAVAARIGRTGEEVEGDPPPAEGRPAPPPATA